MQSYGNCHVMPIRPLTLTAVHMFLLCFFSSFATSVDFIFRFQVPGNCWAFTPLLSPSSRLASRLVAMLRRRTGKDKVPQRDSLVSGSKSEEARLRAEFGDANVKQLVLKPRSKRRNGFIFVLGGLFGIFIALFFANQSDVISLDSLMDLNLESLMDAIPQGIVSDVKQFSVRDPESAVLLSLRYVHVTDDLGAIAARTRYRQL
jgi:hypothetical protein